METVLTLLAVFSFGYTAGKYALLFRVLAELQKYGDE